MARTLQMLDMAVFRLQTAALCLASSVQGKTRAFGEQVRLSKYKVENIGKV